MNDTEKAAGEDQQPEKITKQEPSRADEFNRRTEEIARGIEELRADNRRTMKEIEQLGADQDRADEEADKLIAGLREALDSLKAWKREKDSAADHREKITEPEPEDDPITLENTDIPKLKATITELREAIEAEKDKISFDDMRDSLRTRYSADDKPKQ